jgi:hypothetical protein
MTAKEIEKLAESAWEGCHHVMRMINTFGSMDLYKVIYMLE